MTTPTTALRRITAFEKQFQKSPEHLVLAYHAAFPLALTPDMLYRMAAYFKKDCKGQPLRFPWIGVADILLSPLCEETDEELYEMIPDVRSELLRRLEADDRFGRKRLEQLADFLLIYARQHLQYHNPALLASDMETVREAQVIIAQANKIPDRAVENLAQSLASADLKNNAALIRLSRLTNVVTGASSMQKAADVDKVRQYAQGLEQIARKNQNAATRHFAEAANGRKDVQIGNLRLSIPRQARQGINFPDFFLLKPAAGEMTVSSPVRHRTPSLTKTVEVNPLDLEALDLTFSRKGLEEGQPLPVLAAQRGEVAEVNEALVRVEGKFVRIRHDWPTNGTISTWYTWYCFLDEIFVKEGDFVLAGQEIGTSTNTAETGGTTITLMLQHEGEASLGTFLENGVDPLPYIWQEERPPVVDECRIVSVNSPTSQSRQRFTVHWTVQNIGNTIWGTGYHFTFTNGEQMGGPSPSSVTQPIEPGQELLVPFTLIAPDNPGQYQGVWQPRTPNDFTFPSNLVANVTVSAEMPTVDALVVVNSQTRETVGQAGEPGYTFEVTWQLRNSGLRPWGPTFRLVRVYSTPLRAGTSYQFSTEKESGNVPGVSELTEIELPTVQSGEQISLIVPFSAPQTDGYFESRWQLFNPEGQPIGERLVVTASVGSAARKTALGLFLSDGGEIGEPLVQELSLLKPEAIKILSTVSPAVVHRLATDHPHTSWIIRPFSGKPVSTARQFVSGTINQIQTLVNSLAGHDVWLELHSEPNSDSSGIGLTWRSGEEFAKWFLEVKNQFQEAIGPDVRFLYPGLASGGDFFSDAFSQMDDLRFLEESSP
ncbi:MAG: NBR1-Ig-like domain-containing protein, partial [Candidatus Promineifilaceae bacterium]